ncbi:SCO family protein [Flavobacteriaceae bacterium]|jgi:protein SCO1/2|nr:SCO family protein [Flavobacteriaceae bacterium]
MFNKKLLKRYAPLVITMTIFSAFVVSSFYYVNKPIETLPIYSPSMVSKELVEENIQFIKKYHKIKDFSMKNQNGETITQEFYNDKIYVADFFFTTCPTICPIMTENMGYVQEKIKNDSDVLLLSFSVTPEIDSVEQLKKYAIEKNVIDSKWNLVTGNKKDIYNLARTSYLVAKTNGDGGKYDMIHTENFVLVDKEKRIRGFYDGTNSKEMDQLLNDIKILKNSY